MYQLLKKKNNIDDDSIVYMHTKCRKLLNLFLGELDKCNDNFTNGVFSKLNCSIGLRKISIVGNYTFNL